MKLQISGTEVMDWQEVWCFRCANDHGFSHVPENDQDPDKGCRLLLAIWLGEDQPEWEARDENALCFLPAEVSCRQFKVCDECPPDPPDAERRGGETHREFHDRLRAETLARPVVVDA